MSKNVTARSQTHVPARISAHVDSVNGSIEQRGEHMSTDMCVDVSLYCESTLRQQTRTCVGKSKLGRLVAHNFHAVDGNDLRLSGDGGTATNN